MDNVKLTLLLIEPQAILHDIALYCAEQQHYKS